MITLNVQRKLIYIFFIFISFSVNAQELPLYSQYILNPYLINPAIAGIAGSGALQIMNRSQWLGIKDAPQTNLISYHQGFGNVGLGGHVYSDKNGNTSNMGFQLTYAYHIYLSNKYLGRKNKRLSFGLSVTGLQRKIDESSFMQAGKDPLINGTEEKSFSPNGNFGLYFTNKNFFSGLSCANLIQTTNNIYSPQRTFFLQMGQSFNNRYRYVIEPSITTKFDQQKDWQLDANLKVYLPEKNNRQFWGGLSLRNNMGESFKEGAYSILFIGYNTARLRFAYALEYGLNPIRSNNAGSHEFMLLYTFGNFIPHMCPAYGDLGHLYK